ncbi:alanine dehydrogenase [Planctomycetota bacterium]
MKIGVPKEIKKHEYRVGMTPACVKTYADRGHQVMIEENAGVASGFDDAEYVKAGATIVTDKKKMFDDAEMIVKVKEPLPDEFPLFHEGQIVYTYFHFAADQELTTSLMESGISAVAYETIELPDGSLPCLTPMSEIAGRLSVQEGAKYLEKAFGGRGVLLGGVPGVQRGKIGIIGGGVVGTNACKIAVGIGADVTILDINAKRLAYLDDIFGTRITTLYSTEANVEVVVRQSDLVIGAVLIPGATAPMLVKKSHLAMMKPGAVIVDVAIDQGGCTETSRPTTHDEPIYIEEEIVHYCVTNMPSAVARSSTIALTSVTLSFGLGIADEGLETAAQKSPAIRKGINIHKHKCVHEGVATSLDLEYTDYSSLKS